MTKQINFAELGEDELKTLRTRLENEAQSLDIDFHSSIGTETLYNRIKAHKAGKKPEEEKVTLTEENFDSVMNKVFASPEEVAKLKSKSLNEIRNEQMRLVRVTVLSNDPVKANWQGELIEVSNNLIGEHKRMIPFNVQWHIPQIMLNTLLEKRYLRPEFLKQNGREVTRMRSVPAYNITIEEPITAQELAEIKERQMAQGEDPHEVGEMN